MRFLRNLILNRTRAGGVAELVDAGDSKSPGRNPVWVQVPPPPKGFTLVEVLVSIAIIATVFVVLITLQTQNLRALKRSEDAFVGLMLLQKTKVKGELEEEMGSVDIDEFLEERYGNFEVEREELEVPEELSDLIMEGMSGISGLSGYKVKTPTSTLEFFGG